MQTIIFPCLEPLHKNTELMHPLGIYINDPVNLPPTMTYHGKITAPCNSLAEGDVL